MHYVLRKFGMQTWEYSPEYGLRSYTYLLPHAAVAWAAGQLGANSLFAFFAVRSALALASALAESLLYSAVRDVIGESVADLMFAALFTSTGLFISATGLFSS